MTATIDPHSPERAASELTAKLASRSRHVCLLLGAGAGCAAQLPDLAGLEDEVTSRVSDADRPIVDRLLDGRNLEEGLSRIRRIAVLLEAGGEFEELDHEAAERIDNAICTAIIDSITDAQTEPEPFRRLASWAAGDYYHHPIELFTVNYDTLIEQGLEAVSAPYFDGFIGSLRGNFRPELVEPTDASRVDGLPASFVRVWKLHGSITWAIKRTGSAHTVVRLGAPVSKDDVAAIYPSEEKYDAARRVPFVVLMDRFRRALNEPETITLICGYSFSDEHLTEIVFDAAQRHPRSETVLLCYDEMPEIAAEAALRLPNVTALAAEQAIIGGVRASWSDPLTKIPFVWGEGKFLLGDFTHLASFLGRSRNANFPDDADG